MSRVAGNVAGEKRLGRHLIELVERNAYIRQPNAERRKLEKTNYKKGWEVRLVLRNEAEVEVARRLLEKSGLKAGRPFPKARQWVLPLYGRRMVDLVNANADLRKRRA